MARRKTQPDCILLKSSLAERLRQVRTHLFGERGGPEMARRLGLPIRTWYNYESGVTVPAEVVLKFIEMTGVDPVWLLRGTGEPFREPHPEPLAVTKGVGDETNTVRDLLRAALDRLEARATAPSPAHAPLPSAPPWRLKAPIDGSRVNGPMTTPAPGPERGRGAAPADDPGLPREGDHRCLVMEGQAMSPIVADGAVVAYATRPEPLEALDGQLVVAHVEGQVLVRWLQLSDKFAILRAESPELERGTHLIERPARNLDHTVRRVLWISTPH
jgi:hypothetical protein